MTEKKLTDGSGHRIWPMPGGLMIADNKHQSTRNPVIKSQLPSHLVLPMQQHIGQRCVPLVKLGEQVLKGQKIAESKGHLSAPVHASSSGTIVGIGKHRVPHASAILAPCITIETDGEDKWCQLPAAIGSFKQLRREAIIKRIHDAGVVGLGGAGFVSAVKQATNHTIHTLVINGAECEPYITCDDMLMRKCSEKILNGIEIIMHLLDAKHCLVGIEENKPEAIKIMRAAVTRRIGAPDNYAIAVVSIPARYPSGGEKQLIQILTGKEVPSGGLPADIGIVCQNVGTAAAISDGVLDGKPLVERLVTITGEGITNPGNLNVRIGTRVADLVAQVGGYTGKQAQLIIGGPMMGFTLPDDDIPITKTTNCVLIPSVEEAPSSCAAKPCIRCGKCAEVCPVGLLPQQMYWHIRAKHSEKARQYHLFDCIECGCCSHVCPSLIPLVQYYRFAKAELRAADQDTERAKLARQRSEVRDSRLISIEEEKKARLAAKRIEMKKKMAARKAAEKAGETDGIPEDPIQAVIEAAQKRAASKRDKLAQQGVQPKNTSDLKHFQQSQVDATDRRREQVTEDV